MDQGSVQDPVVDQQATDSLKCYGSSSVPAQMCPSFGCAVSTTGKVGCKSTLLLVELSVAAEVLCQLHQHRWHNRLQGNALGNRGVVKS